MRSEQGSSCKGSALRWREHPGPSNSLSSGAVVLFGVGRCKRGNMGESMSYPTSPRSRSTRKQELSGRETQETSRQHSRLEALQGTGDPTVCPAAGEGAKGMHSQGLLASVPSIAIQGRAAVARGPRPKGAAGSSVPLPATCRFPQVAAWHSETASWGPVHWI